MRLIYLFLTICLVSSAAIARNTVVKQITPDVITISPDRKQLETLGWPNDIINSVAVKTSKGIVLIDTQNSPANANLIKAEITKRFNDTTFVYIVNTHGHSCHSGGNCVFDQNNIVAHVNSIGEIKNYDDIFLGQTVDFLRKKIYHQYNVLDTFKVAASLPEVSDSINESIALYRFYEDDLINNYHVRYPDMTFEDTLTLDAGNKTIKLTYMGKGHGDADIMVYIKEDKVLCTGNLFHLGAHQVDAMPSFYLNRVNEIERWIKTLSTFLEQESEVKQVLTTHGKQPFNRDNIVFINEYCKVVLREIKAAKAAKQPVESVQDFEKFENFFKEYRHVLSVNQRVKEMHARNIGIMWRHIQ